MSFRSSGASPGHNPQRRLSQEKEWRGPVQQNPDRPPHHVSRLVQNLQGALDPKSTIEKRLWGATTLRRCVETSDAEGRTLVRHNDVFVPALIHLFHSVDPSDTGARIREHVLLTLLHLLGDDEAFDEKTVFEPEVQTLLVVGLTDPHFVVVLAAAQVVRRVSECPIVRKWLLYNDALFNQILEVVEICDESKVVAHLLSTLLNLTASEDLQFPLARCARLLQLLLEIVYQPQLPDQSELAVKAFANLLSFPDNVSEVLRLVPPLPNAMIESSQSTHVEIAVAARRVLEFIHDGDLPRISLAITNDFVEGRAFATRLRSPSLGAPPEQPQRSTRSDSISRAASHVSGGLAVADMLSESPIAA